MRHTLEANLVAPTKDCYDDLVKHVFLRANLLGTLSVLLGIYFYFSYQEEVSPYLLFVLSVSFLIFLSHLYIGLKTPHFKFAMSMYLLNSTLTILAISLLLPELKYEALVYLPIGIFAFFYNIYEDRSVYVFSFFAMLCLGFTLYENLIQQVESTYPINILSTLFLILSIVYTFFRVLTLVSLRRNIVNRINKSAEENLKSNMKYQSLFDNSFDAIAIFNLKENKFVKVNKAFVEMFKLSKHEEGTETIEKEELRGTIDNSTLLDNYKQVEKHFKHSQAPLRLEILQCRLNGELFETETTVMPIEGNPDELLAVIKDISAYKKAQQKLQLSETRNRTLIEQNLSAVILADEHSVITEWNEQALQIFGWTKEEALGKRVQELIIPQSFSIHTKAAFTDFLKEINDRNLGKILEIEMRRKNGSSFPVELTLQCLDVDGKRIFSAFIRDISDKKAAEDVLKSREATLDAVINSASDGFVMLDKDKRFVFYNEEAHRAFKRVMNVNLEKDIAVGELFFEKIGMLPTLVTHNNKLLDRVIAGEVIAFDFHSRPEQQKSIKYYNIRMLPVRDSNQVIIGAMCVGREITELKEKGIQLQNAKEKAEESDRLKSAFLANMSHEIRTPMNSIVGFSKLLQEEELSAEESKEFIQIINTNCQQLMNIIDNILDISKIETGQVQVLTKTVHIPNLLQELYELFTPIAAERQLDLILEKNPAFPNFKIETDETKLKQILTNLLTNALKFTNVGSVRFGYAVHQKQVRFFVKDTGIGIAKEKQASIFQQFQQVDNELKRSYEGTGLGLSISTGLAKLLHGNIELESELGKGTTFSLNLAYEGKQGITLPLRQAVDINRKRLLLIEDNVFNTMLIKQGIKDTSVQFTQVTSNEMALAFLETNTCDLILINIEMPNADAALIKKALAKKQIKLPFLALSTLPLNGNKDKLLALGFDEHLSIPIQKTVLLEHLARFL